MKLTPVDSMQDCPKTLCIALRDQLPASGRFTDKAQASRLITSSFAYLQIHLSSTALRNVEGLLWLSAGQRKSKRDKRKADRKRSDSAADSALHRPPTAEELAAARVRPLDAPLPPRHRPNNATQPQQLPQDHTAPAVEAQPHAQEAVADDQGNAADPLEGKFLEHFFSFHTDAWL